MVLSQWKQITVGSKLYYHYVITTFGVKAQIYISSVSVCFFLGVSIFSHINKLSSLLFLHILTNALAGYALIEFIVQIKNCYSFVPLDMHPLAAASRSRLLETAPKLYVFETSYYAFCGRYCFFAMSNFINNVLLVAKEYFHFKLSNVTKRANLYGIVLFPRV